MGKPVYLMDSNSFIEPFTGYYSLEYVPGFWNALIREHQKGNIFTISAIRNELLRREDGLQQWFESDLPKPFIREEDEQTEKIYKSIVSWAHNHPVFSPVNKQKFAGGADGLLVAYAKAHGMVVVTQEKEVGIESKQIKIPNVCKQFDVPYVNVVEMLQALNVRLVLDGPQRHDLFSASGLDD